MKQLLESFDEINVAKQRSDRDVQAHIFLDNGVRETRLSDFSLQLISAIEDSLGINQSINQNLYSAPSRYLFRGAPDPGQAEENSL